ncbi:hypothetical protein SRHO_G00128630 [Serrasalmus rhombeus]
MGLLRVEDLVTGKRCEGEEAGGACAEVYGAGEYESAVNREKQDGFSTHTDLSSANSQNEDNLALNIDRLGHLKLETVDDLFSILELKKRRKERKIRAHKKEPEPEIVFSYGPHALMYGVDSGYLRKRCADAMLQNAHARRSSHTPLFSDWRDLNRRPRRFAERRAARSPGVPAERVGVMTEKLPAP